MEICENCRDLNAELNEAYAAYGRMAQLNEKLQIEINNLYEEKRRAYNLHDVVAERDELKRKLQNQRPPESML